MSPSPEGAQRPEWLPALIPAFRRCCGSVDRDMDRDLKPIADVHYRPRRFLLSGAQKPAALAGAGFFASLGRRLEAAFFRGGRRRALVLSSVAGRFLRRIHAAAFHLRAADHDLPAHEVGPVELLGGFLGRSSTSISTKPKPFERLARRSMAISTFFTGRPWRTGRRGRFRRLRRRGCRRRAWAW